MIIAVIYRESPANSERRGERRTDAVHTTHRLLYQDSRKLNSLQDESIDLIVTSPPYPMIEMWDETFACLNAEIGAALAQSDYRRSFELMHFELDQVWRELFRVLKNGGFACINIGDATRTIGGRFQLFSNHYRILQACWENGFDALPVILWRKQTNAPNKFMGSGMLPAGAYVTLEHEYILILRKGAKRNFRTEAERLNRQASAIYWEERNRWYSDLWDFKGARQNITAANSHLRRRSGAYPFLLPCRIINMYSVYGDTVLDPFSGTGTTTLAAIACGRNSIGCEIDKGFAAMLDKKLGEPKLTEELNFYHRDRIKGHMQFIEQYTLGKGHPPKYINETYGFPVVTRQETRLKHLPLKDICREGEGYYTAAYGSPNEIMKHQDILTSPDNKSAGKGSALYQLQIFE